MSPIPAPRVPIRHPRIPGWRCTRCPLHADACALVPTPLTRLRYWLARKPLPR